MECQACGFYIEIKDDCPYAYCPLCGTEHDLECELFLDEEEEEV